MDEILKSLANLATTKLLAAVVAAMLVVTVGKVVIKFLNKHVTKWKVDPTLHKFLMAVARVIVYFVAVMIVAEALGFEMSSLVALASVVSAAFALAASGTLSNLFGGILLLMTKPFGVGDYISLSDGEGTVLEVGILNTKLITVDNKRITIPNSTIASATVTNYSSEGKRRVELVFSVGYDNDPEKVKSAIRDTAEGMEKIIEKETIFVRVSAYNDCSVSYTCRVWCKCEDYWDVYYDMMEQVKVAFDKLGITMVYPIVNVITKQ